MDSGHAESLFDRSVWSERRQHVSIDHRRDSRQKRPLILPQKPPTLWSGSSTSRRPRMYSWKSLTILLLIGLAAGGYAQENVPDDAPPVRHQKPGLQSALTQLKKDVDTHRAAIERAYKDKQESL